VFEGGLIAGMYYLRTRPAVDAIKFTVDREALQTEDKQDAEDDEEERVRLNLAAMTCSLDNKDACVMCSG
jgi:ribonucleoside-diphosphate reductase subunit M1